MLSFDWMSFAVSSGVLSPASIGCMFSVTILYMLLPSGIHTVSTLRTSSRKSAACSAFIVAPTVSPHMFLCSP